MIDNKLLPLVKKTINELLGNGCARPKKITMSAVEKKLGLASKQLNNLPKCRKEIEKYYESQEQYWAREVVLAANNIISKGLPFNWKHIRQLTNIRKSNLSACMPYLQNFADEILVEKIKGLAIFCNE